MDSQKLLAAEEMVNMVIAMECECAVTVNRAGIAIKNNPGVPDYDVEGFTREAMVRFNDTETNVEKIAEELAEQSFQVEREPDHQESSMNISNAWARQRGATGPLR